MGLNAEDLDAGLTALAAIEPAFAASIGRIGMPAPRIYDRGHATLLRTIVGQQVSVASAAAVWTRLEALVGPGLPLDTLATMSDETLRTAGLSRQKSAYARSLADEVLTGRLHLDALPADDEAAIAALVAVKGIGRWSAEIYLLFAEGRPDVWPAGDLAIQIEVGRLLGLPARPTERETRALAEPWRPHRGAAAIFAWAHYNTLVL
ncbi:DNA-3-methyladenine glycosylase family protein [Sphingomonas prati]|uniref:DNA-3-methyladenine glycosylase II n=1 Tax=Sphingomonas prati TaxID=1843237 RepID=A0A7W9BPV8_9SPHN|nr:DNA-3-methyladenine glycosylase 2 family protein [Sphingomonas prati]MBB5727957.1 DNA-3-methyladenine glycosylase II [Sphingomonas prati]GGE82185.1 DNA-3-methyladenine glycosidase [Sphingomonas prati]